MCIGQKIKQLRKENEMTLDELAKKSGCAKSQIWTVENNINSNPTSKWLSSIATALNVTVNYFLAGEQKPDSEDAAFFDMYLSLPVKTKKQIRDKRVPGVAKPLHVYVPANSPAARQLCFLF